MELERTTAVAAAIEQARERERGIVRVSRSRATEAILQSGAAVAANGLDDLACLRESEWQSVTVSAGHEQILIPLARAAERRVAEERERFMERRKERRQVERMLESAAERARAERERREQRELDDWFGGKRARRIASSQASESKVDAPQCMTPRSASMVQKQHCPGGSPILP